MKSKLVLALSLFLAPLLAPRASAATQVPLGQTYLSNRPSGDYVAFRQPVCDLASIKLGVRGDGAEIYDLRVVFGNGQVQDIPVRSRFARGTDSAWKDLNGAERCVRSIYIFGRSNSNTPRRTLVVFTGLRQAASRPVLLGRTALSNRTQGDFIDLRNPVCGVTRFMIRVLNDAARIEYLTVGFNNGQFQRIDVRRFFARGSSSAWKDLNGGARCIDKIGIVGRSSARPRSAVVEFWAQRR